MINVTMPLYMYNDLRELVKMSNVCYVTEKGRLYAEAEVNAEIFDKVREERGWK